MNPRPEIKIELTTEQKKQIQQLIGKEVPAVKLNLEPLEDRLAPGRSPN
jgi:hypothetical protein